MFTGVSRGLSLVEVLVGAGVMLLLFTGTLAIYLQARKAQEKSDIHNDAFRTVALAHDKVSEVLRGARVVAPAVQNTDSILVLQLPVMTPEGLPQVNASGALVRGAGAAEILVDEGRLLRREGGVDQVLVPLGSGGRAEFERTAGDLLRVTLRAQAGVTVYESFSEHHLANQP